jgi:hypothetical protein
MTVNLQHLYSRSDEIRLVVDEQYTCHKGTLRLWTAGLRPQFA